MSDCIYNLNGTLIIRNHPEESVYELVVLDILGEVPL